MIDLHDAWSGLRHGGNLLDHDALRGLPPLRTTPVGLADGLRYALTDLPDEGAARGEALSALLDVVLERATGLHAGWRKGSDIGASEAEKLLDGTALKPRRLWRGPAGETLAVFLSPVTRLGVGVGRRPVAQVTEYLRRRKLPLGLLTNGREWRLIWAEPDAFAWVEWDADRWLEGDQLSNSLHVFRRILSWESLCTPKTAELSLLLTAIRATRRGQAKLSSALGENVRRSVELLLRARQPVLPERLEVEDRRALYVAGCHFVMRLVVLLFAEHRELLPVDNPIYHQAYGLRGLIDQLQRLSPDQRRGRRSGWPRLLALFRLLHGGSGHEALLVPAYGSALFAAGEPEGDGVQRALALLEAPSPKPDDEPDDEAVFQLLLLLARTTTTVQEGAVRRTVAAPVNFTELTSEYIGILYEGLLDYELHRAEAQPVLFLGLGDEPALPLDRLEQLDDKALAALVEKAKAARVADEDADEEDGGEDEAPAEQTEDVGPVGDVPEDADHATARDRARRWAERAAVVGGLVRRPRGRRAEEDKAYREELSLAANQLVRSVKLPGELYLVRWGGTRKGHGTFYTRPQLTMPTIRRTLAPLLRDADGVSRTPEEILALKVCDPAMGSGSFLVAALRVLTEAVLRSLHEHGLVRRQGDILVVDCATLPEEDRQGTEDRLEAVVRRAVVEHCLYGVDIDPLAVELARVALWIETLDRRLPFTFLDHKLRCGDALIGTWMDRFRHYPLLAWERQSPDSRWNGVNHEPDRWAKQLKDRKQAVIAEQVAILAGQQKLAFAETSDEELQAAIVRVRRRYGELRKIPASHPEERARIWREKIQDDPDMIRVKEAFDTWCALWFWPPDRITLAPGPGTLHQPDAAARGVVKELRDRARYFHWELEFPDVFVAQGAGFNAVVGNPPWEIQKPNSREFFSDLDPLYRSYGKQDALRKQRELFKARPEIEERWLRYFGGFKDRGNFVRFAAEPFGDAKVVGRDGGDVSLGRAENTVLHQRWRRQRQYKGLCDPGHPFRHQGSADLNTYKMFLEQGHALLRDRGQLGLVVPSGFYSDQGSRPLRKLLIDEGRVQLLYVFQNERKVFADVDHRFKQLVVVVEKGGGGGAFPAIFRVGPGDSPEVDELPDDIALARGAVQLSSEQVSRYSPRSLALLEVRHQRDLEILDRMYTQGVLLGDRTEGGWGASYAREFDMTNDSALFPARERWEARGFQADALGRWVTSDGTVALPLLQGAMIHELDHAYKGWVQPEAGRPDWAFLVAAQGRDELVRAREPGQSKDAWVRYLPGEKSPLPKYLMAERDYRDAQGSVRGLKVVFRDIARSTDERTAIAALAADHPCGNVLGVLSAPTLRAVSLAMFMSSLTFDWVTRLRSAGTHLNLYLLEELVCPRPGDGLSAPALLAARLGMASQRFAPYWLELAESVSLRSHPWRRLWAVTPHERLRLRCMLDAIVAKLYGLDSEDLAWILRGCDHPAQRLSESAFCRTLDPKGFWRAERDRPPELRHTVLTQVAFDTLQALVVERRGDLDAAIVDFCAQNDGDGWMLPETLCLAEHGLGQDERADVAQPVASMVGPRFLDWQLNQSVRESWLECERHARALLGDEEFTQRFGVSQMGPGPADFGTFNPYNQRPARGRRQASTPQALSPQTALFVERPRTTTGSSSPQGDAPVAWEPPAMHLSAVRLLNFRGWTDEHWQPGVELRALTVLLGRNSSGKTSLIQPIRLLKQTVRSGDDATQLELGSDDPEMLEVGEFSSLVHNGDKDSLVGLGVDIDDDCVRVAVQYRMDRHGRPVVAHLDWHFGDDHIELERVAQEKRDGAIREGLDADSELLEDHYQLRSPHFRLPSYQPPDRVNPLEPSSSYAPYRGVELSSAARATIGSELNSRWNKAFARLRAGLEEVHYLGPLRPPPGRTVLWRQQKVASVGSLGALSAQALIASQMGAELQEVLPRVSEWLKRLDLAESIEVRRKGDTLVYEIVVVRGGRAHNLMDVGYGVSQVLPVIVLLHVAKPGSTLMIEDPEAHLHPMAQAKLADLFAEVASQRNLQLIVETHSEHLFRRLQFLVANDDLKPKDCALYYVESDGDPSVKLRTLDMDEFGRLRNWPKDFFGDAVGETERQIKRIFERMAPGAKP